MDRCLSRMGLRGIGRRRVAIDIIVSRLKKLGVSRVGTAVALGKSSGTVTGMPGAVLIVLPRRETAVAWLLIAGKAWTAPSHVIPTTHETARALSSRRRLCCKRSTGGWRQSRLGRLPTERRRMAGVRTTATTTGKRAATCVVRLELVSELVLVLLA